MHSAQRTAVALADHELVLSPDRYRQLTMLAGSRDRNRSSPVPRSESFQRRADLSLCITFTRRRRRGTHHFSDGSGGAGAWNGSSGRRRILSGSLVRLGAANWCSRIIEVRRVIVPVPVYGCERLQAGLALCHRSVFGDLRRRDCALLSLPRESRS